MDSWENGDVVQRVGGVYKGMVPGDKGVVVDRVRNEVGAWGTGHNKGNFVLVQAASASAAVTDRKDDSGKLDMNLLDDMPRARKDDSGKLDMNLLDDMPRALKAIVEVMQWAIVDKKPVPYVRGSWLGVEPDRYRAAIKRHERAAAEQATPEVPARLQCDDETNLLHLAHTACSAMMALENTLRELEKQ